MAGIPRRFSMSHGMYNDGHSVSFSKLVRLARLTDPVIGLSYFDASRNKASIANDEDFVKALRQYPEGDLVVRTRIQENPYVLTVRDALLTGENCKLGSWSTPNVMFKSDTAMACWDLSSVLQGYYRVSSLYWRDLNKGQANFHIGVVTGTDAKTVAKQLADPEVCAELLSPIQLNATGVAESEFVKAPNLGQFNIRSNPYKDTETCFLVVTTLVDRRSGQPRDLNEVFVSNMELTYLGPIEYIPSHLSVSA